MKSAPFCPKPRNSAGFTLMEVMLALALFSIAAVALANALNQIGVTTLAVHDTSRRLELVHSYLQEASKAPEIATGTETIEIEPGFKVKIVTETAKLTNQEGENLPDMFRIHVQALEGKTVVEEAETLRFAPLYVQ